jgi:hypothetical protein
MPLAGSRSGCGRGEFRVEAPTLCRAHKHAGVGICRTANPVMRRYTMVARTVPDHYIKLWPPGPPAERSSSIAHWRSAQIFAR